MTRRVLITGATRGLGRALTRAYVESGTEVWAGYRHDGDEAELEEVGALPVHLDVTVPASVDRVARRLDRLDVLVNNAGVDSRAFGSTFGARTPTELDLEAFRCVLGVNVIGTLSMTRAVLPALTVAGPGRVVTVTSQLGVHEIGSTRGPDIGYNASKAALSMVMARFASLTKVEDVMFLNVHPGWLRTDLGGADAPGDPGAAAKQLRRLGDEFPASMNGCYVSLPDLAGGLGTASPGARGLAPERERSRLARRARSTMRARRSPP